MDVNPSTDPSVIFASDSTCILGPDTTEGPYCTSPAIAISDILTSADVTGELIRSDITEDQQGVPLYLDMQMINPRTCEPVPDIYLDFWQCNSTVCAYRSLPGRRDANEPGRVLRRRRLRQRQPRGPEQHGQHLPPRPAEDRRDWRCPDQDPVPRPLPRPRDPYPRYATCIRGAI
jgi:hypothetical protein